MKLMSTTALGLALIFGAVTVATVAPQAAEAKGGPQLKLSDAVRKPVAAAQEALKKNDTATAITQLDAAKAVAKTPDESYVINSVLYEVGKLTKDNKTQATAVAGMIDSGKVDAASLPTFNMVLGQLSYFTQDYARAEQALQAAIDLKTSEPAAYALLAESKFRLKKPAEAVAVLQQAADAGIAAGKPIPNDWYGRGIAIGTDAKLPDAVTKLSLSWLKAYPDQTHWRDSLVIYRDLHTLDADTALDLMRLQRDAGALRGERDFVDLAEATYIKFPNEALSVIEAGIAAGAINPTQSRAATELKGLASSKVAADKASLTKNAANARSAVGNADAYMSYGDTASAIELYRKALTLGGADANLVNLRLGAALAKAGQTAEAKTVLSSITTGPRADIARYRLLMLDTPAGSPAMVAPAPAAPAN